MRGVLFGLPSKSREGRPDLEVGIRRRRKSPSGVDPDTAAALAENVTRQSTTLIDVLEDTGGTTLPHAMLSTSHICSALRCASVIQPSMSRCLRQRSVYGPLRIPDHPIRPSESSVHISTYPRCTEALLAPTCLVLPGAKKSNTPSFRRASLVSPRPQQRAVDQR